MFYKLSTWLKSKGSLSTEKMFGLNHRKAVVFHESKRLCCCSFPVCYSFYKVGEHSAAGIVLSLLARGVSGPLWADMKRDAKAPCGFLETCPGISPVPGAFPSRNQLDQAIPLGWAYLILWVCFGVMQRFCFFHPESRLLLALRPQGTH